MSSSNGARQICQARMGATIYGSLKNTNQVLPSPRANQPIYAIFILVSFSSLPLPVNYISISAADNFKSSYVSTYGEL